MTSNDNSSENYSYEEVFGEHIQQMKEEHEKKHSVPVAIKAKSQEEIEKDKKEREEQEAVHKELAKHYCICKHKKTKHDLEGYGECKHTVTRLWQGQLQQMDCDCKQFVSIQDQAESIPERW